MAKKTTTKAPAKAKKSTANAEPSPHAVALAVLKRASSVITADAKKANDGEVPELPSGTYPLDVQLRINGDVIVAAPTQSKPKPKPAFTDEQLAACAFFRDMSLVNACTAVLSNISNSELELVVAKYRAARDAAAKKADLWETPTGEDKAGAVTGSPSVRIDGSYGKSKVLLTVDAA